MKGRFLILTFITLISWPIFGFSQDNSSGSFNPNGKGKIFVHWGYNRSVYSNSNISFKGPDHNFELFNVAATDRQSPFSFKTYFGLTTFTIPQYNFVIGYFINDNLSISFNADHMKYVVTQDQETRISGYIGKRDSKYDGVYEDTPIVLSSDFLQFEHTDGLNYTNIELTQYVHLWKNKKEAIDISGCVGFAIGALIPRSDVVFLGEGSDEFHLAGFGSSLTAGITLTLFKHVMVQYKIKGGYINMPDIVTNGRKQQARAQQSFLFMERLFTIGTNFQIKGNK